MSKITITKDKLSLSGEEIERMVKDAETYKAKDDEHRKKINNAIEQVFQWLDDHELLDSGLYEDKLKWVQSVCNPISTYLRQPPKSF